MRCGIGTPGMRDAELPSLQWIAAALRKTTETLVRELDAPTAAAPSWDDNEWRVARACAAIHGISPLLAGRLVWQGPSQWHQFVAEQFEHTRRRHRRIASLLASIDRAACDRGLSVAGLKGAALHHLGLYREGERPMSDVDLLVRPEDCASATALIEELGYEFDCRTEKHLIFSPRTGAASAAIGEHADNPIKIELHTSIFEQLPLARCDVSELMLPSCERSGLSFYRTRGALMVHLLVHAAGMITSHGMRALQLHDIALVAKSMTDADWATLLELDTSRRLWWAFPPLALTARYFQRAVPDFVLRRTAAACAPQLLRVCRRNTLTDMSASDPHIRAFVGIEWSRSIGEALRFIWIRLRPSRQTIALRGQYGKYHSLGADMAWMKSSRPRRVMRWLAGNAARVETMASVRAAFVD